LILSADTISIEHREILKKKCWAIVVSYVNILYRLLLYVCKIGSIEKWYREKKRREKGVEKMAGMPDITPGNVTIVITCKYSISRRIYVIVPLIKWT